LVNINSVLRSFWNNLTYIVWLLFVPTECEPKHFPFRITFICRITRYPVFFTSTRYKKPNLRNAGTELKVFRPL